MMLCKSRDNLEVQHRGKKETQAEQILTCIHLCSDIKKMGTSSQVWKTSKSYCCQICKMNRGIVYWINSILWLRNKHFCGCSKKQGAKYVFSWSAQCQHWLILSVLRNKNLKIWETAPKHSQTYSCISGVT